jgi:UDP-N-acetylglucosamine acyltransferase
VDAGARLADDVEVGPYCVVGPDVVIGAGTVLRAHVVVRGHTVLGRGNLVDPFCVLGGSPRDGTSEPGTVSGLRIGDGNTFREAVTLCGGSGRGDVTQVASDTYWMVGSHASSGCGIADGAILTNGAVLGDHVEVGRRAVLSAHFVAHSYCWIGELVMAQGSSAVSTHVPPYSLVALPADLVAGLNRIGLRRAQHIDDEDRRQIREAFRITYRSRLTPPEALERMDRCAEWGEAAGRFREFIRRVVQADGPFRRGLCPCRRRAASG